MRYFKYLPGGFTVETPDMDVARVVEIYNSDICPYYEPHTTYSNGWINLGSKDDGWEEVSHYGLKSVHKDTTSLRSHDDIVDSLCGAIKYYNLESLEKSMKDVSAPFDSSVFDEFISEDSSDFELQDFQSSVLAITHDIALMLIGKNKKYGNSALEPIRIFSKSDSIEQINVRIDDKLSRIKNANELEDEDVISDLIGYLVLLKLKRNENVRTTEA